jgi:hypothetical protein
MLKKRETKDAKSKVESAREENAEKYGGFS